MPYSPLTLSLSKGVSGGRAAVAFPLKWFDKLTMSGNQVVFSTIVSITNPTRRCCQFDAIIRG